MVLNVQKNANNMLHNWNVWKKKLQFMLLVFTDEQIDNLMQDCYGILYTDYEPSFDESILAGKILELLYYEKDKRNN